MSIKEKNLKHLLDGTTIGLIGSRGTGKTNIIKTLLYYKKPFIRFPLLISGTAQTNGDFIGVIPEILTFDKYIPDKVQNFIADQTVVKNKLVKGDCKKNVKNLGFLIMDDIVGTDPIWKKDPNVNKIFYAGRHFNITNILSVQTPLKLPSNLRGNLDYVIITSVRSKRDMEVLYEQYWNGRFGDKKKFEKYVTKILSKKHRFVLLDNKSKADDVTEYLYYVKPPHPKYIPVEKVGLKYIWEIEKRYFNPNWITKDMNITKSKIKKDVDVRIDEDTLKQ